MEGVAEDQPVVPVMTAVGGSVESDSTRTPQPMTNHVQRWREILDRRSNIKSIVPSKYQESKEEPNGN
jgi:hypothetical protein